MDFVHDQLATGRKLRVLTIVNTFSRFSPALEPRFRGADVVEVLERVGRQVGFPTTIRIDRGTEFVSRDLDLWAYQRGVTLDFSRPGKPTDNAFIEAFNGRFRAECLNAHWFLSLADAQKKLEAWRKYYNKERPHGAIGHRPPDYVAESRRRNQPTIVREPENSPRPRSKLRSQSKPRRASNRHWMKVQWQVRPDTGYGSVCPRRQNGDEVPSMLRETKATDILRLEPKGAVADIDLDDWRGAVTTLPPLANSDFEAHKKELPHCLLRKSCHATDFTLCPRSVPRH